VHVDEVNQEDGVLQEQRPQIGQRHLGPEGRRGMLMLP
jgi:hypothetical protein